MSAIQQIRCPNCGNFAERQVFINRQIPDCNYVVKTACETCDYLMVMSFPTGKVLEAYAPGQPSFPEPSSEVKVPNWIRDQESGLERPEKIIESISDLLPHAS